MADTFNRFSGARSTYAAKKPVRAATTANITLSGFQTIDDVVFSSTDESNNYNMRCLVKNQTDATENGIYEVSSGDWSRPADFDGNTDFTRGTSVYVAQGTENGGRIFHVSSSDPQSIGENDLSFSNFNSDNVSSISDDIIASSTVDLDSATGDIVDITGNTTIDEITLSPGRRRLVRFTGTPTLTNSATLVLPGGADIVVEAGDYALFVGYDSDIVRCAQYTRADAGLLIEKNTILYVNTTQAATAGSTTETALASYTVPSGTIDSTGCELIIDAFGTCAATTTTKQLLLYVSDVEFANTSSVPINNTSWSISGIVLASSSASLIGRSVLSCGDSSFMAAISSVASSTASITGAIDVSVSAVCESTAASEAILSGIIVRLRKP